MTRCTCGHELGAHTRPDGTVGACSLCLFCDSYRPVDRGQIMPPHAACSETSRAAAEAKITTSATQRGEVLRAIRDRGDFGATCDEIETALKIPHQAASARIWELRGRNRRAMTPPMIRESGARRRTRSGRLASVYVAVEAGGRP